MGRLMGNKHRKSRTQRKREKVMEQDEKFNETLTHIIMAEIYDYEAREKVHDKSLDIITTYALKAEALLKRALKGELKQSDYDALMEEKPDIEGYIITDHRMISKEELQQYKDSTENIRKKLWNQKN